MPRFDGTGPEGFGPMTGRGAGVCIPVDDVRFGRRMGRRGGQGRGRNFRARQCWNLYGIPMEEANLTAAPTHGLSTLHDRITRLEHLTEEIKNALLPSSSSQKAEEKTESEG